MKQIELPNGLICVVGQRNHEGLTLSATVKVGHLNEPKLGLAAVYEKVIMLQAPEVATIYGGTITSYLTGGETKDFKAYIEKMAKLVAYPELNEELLKNAVEDIIALDLLKEDGIIIIETDEEERILKEVDWSSANAELSTEEAHALFSSIFKSYNVHPFSFHLNNNLYNVSLSIRLLIL